MQEEAEASQVFTPEMIDTVARIWTRSIITLIDVRFQNVASQTPLEQYKMPSSMFIYAYGGEAQIQLNETTFGMERFGLVHGGKGSLLSISPKGEIVKIFMVFYKAESPLFFQRHLQQLLEEVNPFVQQFGYTPSNPILLLDWFQQLMNGWNRGKAMDQLQAKSFLYQLVHGVYRDFESGEIRYLQPDPACSTKIYLDKHYMQPIMFQEIADMFGISGGQLTRLFKKKEGMSLQEYLIQKRIEAACQELKHTEATIKEIATGTGFTDEKNLFRMFKKYYKMTPSDYRKINALSMQVDGIDNHSHFLYYERELAGLVQSYREGESTMFGKVRSKEMILAAAMSLMFLLSACASGTPSNNGGTVNPIPAQTQQTTQSEVSDTKASEAVSQTRTISTVKGDVKVPNNPQRVVVDYLVGDVVALGVTPLGVARAARDGKEAVFANQITDSIKVAMEPEDVMTLEPDLIILAWGDENYEDLSKIAPTIYVPYGDMTTEERIHFIGDVLNKQEEAKAVLSAYAGKIEEAKLALQNAGLSDVTITMGEFSDKSNYIAGAKHAVGDLVYNELKMKAPSKVQTDIIDSDKYWGDISMEVLAAYIGDYLIAIGDTKVPTDNTVWKSLPAVQHNRIVTVGTSLSWSTDIMTSSALIDHIVNQLLTMAK
ncbi:MULTISPECIES: AraC family transcriptional regulator [unclassified Paenibacillus]|uniref:AraC family transcriptional regulator n=1 Tax=unclassified Paenibacillus TaxID=185978 RepID=UPI0009A8AC1B|nr:MULTISPECIES: AraC family transcriptional regulator [unclassified Paenibacillus]SLJ88238.1 iron complex transport system substrate-binding protein [Paenibacillus sp. RU5A]SOC64574.1 iron complex transport system substrate-binding protein [Paenibacillus sp. RU26A]SOC68594.1 iron complex transport system substrate-binding protein [Paenibacillus sp. RU5M]